MTVKLFHATIEYELDGRTLYTTDAIQAATLYGATGDARGRFQEGHSSRAVIHRIEIKEIQK